MTKFSRFAHQAEILKDTRDLEAYGLLWEQGCGKTRPIIETIEHLKANGEIDGVLVLAPNGVHRNWVTDELPLWGEELTKHAWFWESSKAGNVGAKKQQEWTLKHSPFPFVTFTYKGFMTKRGRAWCRRLFKGRRILMILDEAHAIKSPGAKRTIAILAAGKLASHRRILTGTIAPDGNPFDVYGPIKFLDSMFWKDRGLGTFATFKQYFGIWEEGINGQTGQRFAWAVGYKNIDELRDMIKPLTSRVTKDSVLDLPPKLYSKRYFDLTPEQKRIYKDLEQECLALLANGELITAPLAITRLLRFAQVTSNYIPVGEGDEQHFVDISPNNPRLNCLLELCEEISHSAIIWARFRRDVDQICEALGEKAVRYDGAVNNDDRAAAKAAFQAGEAQFFVGNPAAGATGLTLTRARTVIYYNNSFRLVDRLQSEDRAHRIGQEHPVEYVDIVAPGTVDVRIVAALRKKVDVAAAINGDSLKEWI